MEFAITFTLNVISLVCILMIVGLGMAVIFGLMHVINLAHGEFITLGAFTLAVTNSLGQGYWLALFLAPLVGGGAGFVLEWALIRHLYKRPLDTILVTWGLSLIITQILLLVFGTQPLRVEAPVEGLANFLGASYPAYRLLVITLALLLLGFCLWVFYRTSFGLDIRTTIQDREMAEAVGINTRRVSSIAFSGGAAMAAVAGVLIAPLVVVQAYMGTFYLARAFFVVIIGGVGGLAGVAAGSTLVGSIETALSYEVPATLAQAGVLVIAIIVMRFRPQGLLPGL
jgi:branched-chain amino acid transport system permease protein/urea transport system permease protein